jgi:hypothetical protein
MEMRGETVDVNRIRQNVREGMDNMKERMKDWGSEVKESAQNISSKAREFTSSRGKAFANDIRETTSTRGRGFGHAIAVLFKVFFLFIAGTIAFGLFVAVMALIFGGVAWWPINNFLWTSDWQQALAWATMILFFLVPLIAFITWVVRRIIRARSTNNYLGWVFGGLWALGWIAGILFMTSIFRDFREYEHTDMPVVTAQPVNNRMVVTVSQPELEYTGSFGWMDEGKRGWDLSSDTLKIAAVKMNVKASPDSQYHVTVKKYSFGRTNEEALSRAEKIDFAVSSKDSLLDLDNAYIIDSDSKFRFQNVEIEILVPVGKKIYFDPSVERKLNSMDVKVSRSYRRNRLRNIEFETHDGEFEFVTGVDYIMGIDGDLKGSDGKPIVQPDNNYRYDEEVKPLVDSIQLEKTIERKKQELKELEEKRIKSSKPTGFKKKQASSLANDYAWTPLTAAFSEGFN